GGMPGSKAQLFEQTDVRPAQVFIGLVLAYDPETKEALIEQRNHFRLGQKVEILHTDGSRESFLLERMTDEDGNPLDVAPHPKQRIRIRIPFSVEANAMVRRS
ncbi:MAG: U32 family peptidase C-terminal domain-containing protein, partial [Acholeplasmataceae bacterium]